MQKGAAAGTHEVPTMPAPELFKKMKSTGKVKGWVPTATDNAVSILTRSINEHGNLLMGLNCDNIAVTIDDIQDCKANAKGIRERTLTSTSMPERCWLSSKVCRRFRIRATPADAR